MGIIPLKTLTNSQIDRTAGIVTNRFTEFDDDEEQEMMEEGVYSRGAHANVLTMSEYEHN